MFDVQTIRRMNSAGDYKKADVIKKWGDTLLKASKVANNTWRLDLIGAVVIVFHKTIILTIWPSGAVTVDTGGWQTVTTKDRINRFQNLFRVSSDRGEWFVYVRGHKLPFSDGMTISPPNCADIAVTTTGHRIEPICQGSILLAVRAGNLITRAIECWGTGSGYWRGVEPEDSIYALVDAVAETGIKRDDVWDLMDPHVHAIEEA